MMASGLDSFFKDLITIPCLLQPLVPTVDAKEGKWVKSEPFKLVLNLEGHGVIWKLASDKGIFDWFYSHGCRSATVRQIRYTTRVFKVPLFSLSPQ